MLEYETDSGVTFYLLGDEVNARIVANVVDHLPADAQAFVSERVLFVQSGLPGDAGDIVNATCYKWGADRWIVAISDRLDRAAADVLAHEIAHAYLGHGDTPDDVTYARQESEAA
ncbi:MAG: hypothetical protein AB1716_23730, partial [Planctomycetota bacterium]